MAISVDTVYRTVQRFLNIEQRGQLPPGDFNHFATQGQLEIFNQTIYDLAHFKLNPKGVDYNLMQSLEEQIDVFMTTFSYTPRTSLPVNLHTLIRVVTGEKVAEKMMHKDVQYITSSSLTAPTSTFPKYTRVYSGDGVGALILYPDVTDNVDIEYIRKPLEPKWSGVAIQGTDLFNSNDSVDFELHNSRQDDLIMKILLYAGVSIKQQDIVAFASGSMQQEEASEKQ